MYIHAGIEETDDIVVVRYRSEPALMVGDFKHLPSKDDVRTFTGVDRTKEANSFYRGLYAAAFVVRESMFRKMYDTNLGTNENGGP